MNAKDSTSVLILGGGLVGLSTAVFLASRDVPTILIEKHSRSSAHPRAIGYTPRTLEHYHSVGIADRIPEVPNVAAGKPRRVRVESLAGKWFDEQEWTPKNKDQAGKHEQQQQKPPTNSLSGEAKNPAVRKEYSPQAGAAVSQDVLEPILRTRAIELGADVRLSHRLLRFTESAGDGVIATIQREEDKSEYTIHAPYMVACDGHRSPVRTSLGITQSGKGHLRSVRSVLFRAPLDEYLKSGISQFSISMPSLGEGDKGEVFLTTYQDGRWVIIFSDDTERPNHELLAVIQQAIGRKDVPIEIITTGLWEIKALIASSFASPPTSPRVFLAGDAAHTLPPNRGGFGANTGIDDAHNIAWKLASVIHGTSSPHLLTSYDAERRPIAWLRHDQIFARSDYKLPASFAEGQRGADAPPAKTEVLDDEAIEFGPLYQGADAAVNLSPAEERAVKEGTRAIKPAMKPEQWSGWPGTRAQHLKLATVSLSDTALPPKHSPARFSPSSPTSTLDLLSHHWTLLSRAPEWARTGAVASKHTGVEIQFLTVLASNEEKESRKMYPEEEGGSIVLEGEADAFEQAFGLGKRGAALVRPDGYVAWRCGSVVVGTDRGEVGAEVGCEGQDAGEFGAGIWKGWGRAGQALEDAVRKVAAVPVPAAVPN